nr:proline-rich receptor-like protein kinase PERK10 [Aegilops tauschii subsp. strangulata]
MSRGSNIKDRQILSDPTAHTLSPTHRELLSPCPVLSLPRGQTLALPDPDSSPPPAATHLHHPPLSSPPPTSPPHPRSSPHSQIQLATVERGDRDQDLRDAVVVVADRSSADPRKFPGAKVPRGVRAAVRPPRAGPVRDGGGERPPQQGRRRGLEGEARLRWQRAGGGSLTPWSSVVGTSPSRVWPPSQVSEQHQEDELPHSAPDLRLPPAGHGLRPRVSAAAAGEGRSVEGPERDGRTAPRAAPRHGQRRCRQGRGAGLPPDHRQ